MSKVEILRNKGFSIRPEEEQLRARLESLQQQLRRPNQFRGKANELWAQLQMIYEAQQMYGGNGVPGQETWEVVDESQLARIAKVRGSFFPVCSLFQYAYFSGPLLTPTFLLFLDLDGTAGRTATRHKRVAKWCDRFEYHWKRGDGGAENVSLTIGTRTL